MRLGALRFLSFCRTASRSAPRFGVVPHRSSTIRHSQTAQRKQRFVTAVWPAVRRSITRLCSRSPPNRLETALHGSGVQSILVFNCDCVTNIPEVPERMLDEDRRDMHSGWPAIISRVAGVAVSSRARFSPRLCTAPQDNSRSQHFRFRSTPADSIRHLSLFSRCHGLIFLWFSVTELRGRESAAERRTQSAEPAQVYGSTRLNSPGPSFRF